MLHRQKDHAQPAQRATHAVEIPAALSHKNRCPAETAGHQLDYEAPKTMLVANDNYAFL